jgi:cytochrome c peroxidase
MVRWVAGITGALLCGTALHRATVAEAAGDAAVARTELGRRLFFDPAVGRRGQVACAACHDPEHGFSDARPRSQDETRVLPRHSQSLVDLAGSGFHWDGEFDTIRQVIDARVLPAESARLASAERSVRRLIAIRKTEAGRPNLVALREAVGEVDRGGAYGVEAEFPDIDRTSDDLVWAGLDPRPDGREAIESRVARGGRYDVGFTAAFGDAAVTPERIGDALEAYLGSLKSAPNRLDRLLAGDASALSESARRGLDLFRGKAACSQCHVIDGARPPLTDGLFHNTGVARAAAHGRASEGGADPEDADFGRLASTFAEPDRGAFKTPGLRDVARRAPYFHDASAATLTDVVRYYDKGGTANAHLDPKLHALHLTDGDVTDLVAFLESLTGDVRPGLAPASAMRAPRLSIRVENLDGSPVVRRSVVVRPFGDRLECAAESPVAVHATTDSEGRATIDMPASTHVVVAVRGADETEPLPDWTTSATVLVVPQDRVALRVRFPTNEPGRPKRFLATGIAPAEPRSTVEFANTRYLSENETLYVAKRPAGPLGRELCTVVPNNAEDPRVGTYVLDLAPGAENLIDLRAKAFPRDESAFGKLQKHLAVIRAIAGPSVK